MPRGITVAGATQILVKIEPRDLVDFLGLVNRLGINARKYHRAIAQLHVERKVFVVAGVFQSLNIVGGMHSRARLRGKRSQRLGQERGDLVTLDTDGWQALAQENVEKQLVGDGQRKWERLRGFTEYGAIQNRIARDRIGEKLEEAIGLCAVYGEGGHDKTDVRLREGFAETAIDDFTRQGHLGVSIA